MKLKFINDSENKLIFICNYIENYIKKTRFNKFMSCEINLKYKFQIPYNFLIKI